MTVTRILNCFFPKFRTLTLSTATVILPSTAVSFLRRFQPLEKAAISNRVLLLPAFFCSLSTPAATESTSLGGCDFQHHLIGVQNPEEHLTREEIIDSYIKKLAEVVGSEEEAKRLIYSVSTRYCFCFGARIDREVAKRIRGLPGVKWVFADSYLDPQAEVKTYGGEPFVNGEAVPYDPKYHKEWEDIPPPLKAKYAGPDPSNTSK